MMIFWYKPQFILVAFYFILFLDWFVTFATAKLSVKSVKTSKNFSVDGVNVFVLFFSIITFPKYFIGIFLKWCFAHVVNAIIFNNSDDLFRILCCLQFACNCYLFCIIYIFIYCYTVFTFFFFTSVIILVILSFFFTLLILLPFNLFHYSQLQSKRKQFE